MRVLTTIGPGLLLLVLAGATARADEPTKPTATASERDPATPAAGHSIHGESFNDGPRQRAVLLSGMGEVEFPVTTPKAEAQAFIDQGVAQLHTFYYLEAERSFRQAALLDPDCVMAYWGMAMANVNNAKRAKGFLRAARDRERLVAISRRERLYLDALEALYKDGADEKRRRGDHLLGLEAIVQEFPDDLDARAWLAMVAWQNGSKDGMTSRQAVEELIRSIERVAPMHPGMHHYRIHLWDGNKPEQALRSAALYGLAAPGIAHAWHMPGHTYSGLKRYRDAAYQQEASARVDHAAMARDRLMPFEIHNYAHNNQWLCTTYSHLGRVRDAVAVARNLVEQPRDPDRNGKNDGGSPQRSGRARWSEVLVRYELWDDLIAATESGALDWSDVPIERKERAYTLGLAHAARGDRDRLASQIAALKEIGNVADDDKEPEPAEPPKPAGEAGAEPVRGEAPKDEAPKGETPKGETSKDEAPKGETPQRETPRGERARRKDRIPGLKSAIAELEGHAKLLEGEAEEALKLFESADAMRPEARARVQLRAGRVEEAVATARKAVERDANQVAPLACLVEVLHAAGKEDEARDAYRRLRSLAQEADPDLPVLLRLERLAAEWSASGWTPPTSGPEDATDEATAGRVDLDTLGPLTYAPHRAEPFELVDTEGRRVRLEDYRGRKNVVIVFYLGGSCAHCMQQLQVFGEAAPALRDLDTELLAIGTDGAEATRALKENDEGVRFPMPLLADPGLAVFRAYRSFDDFEGLPMHGTFLIDREGLVRYRRIGPEPFLDVRFVREEAARVNRLTAPDSPPRRHAELSGIAE